MIHPEAEIRTSKCLRIKGVSELRPSSGFRELDMFPSSGLAALFFTCGMGKDLFSIPIFSSFLCYLFISSSASIIFFIFSSFVFFPSFCSSTYFFLFLLFLLLYLFFSSYFIPSSTSFSSSSSYSSESSSSSFPPFSPPSFPSLLPLFLPLQLLILYINPHTFFPSLSRRPPYVSTPSFPLLFLYSFLILLLLRSLFIAYFPYLEKIN
jgi:hypothetical protein